jgi:hypothetical protein
LTSLFWALVVLLPLGEVLPLSLLLPQAVRAIADATTTAATLNT